MDQRLHSDHDGHAAQQEINIGCLHVMKSLTPFFDVGLLISFKPYHSSFSSVAHLHKLIKKKKKS